MKKSFVSAALAALCSFFAVFAAFASGTPLTMQVDRSLDPSPIYACRTTTGTCTMIGTVSSAGTWTPLGPTALSFAPSATIDTTNASNITSGTLPPGRLPPISGDCTTSVGSAAITCTKVAGVTAASVGANTFTGVQTFGGGVAFPTLTGFVYGNGGSGATAKTPTQATALLTPFVGDSGSGGTQGVVPAALPGDAAAGKFLSANGGFAVPAVSTASRAPIRQTVASGPFASGAPSFIPATSGTLALTAQNVSTGANSLVITGAQGFGASGAVDAVYQFTANPSWTCTGSAACYLFVNASTGVTSTQTLPSIYQCGGTIAVTSGQFTFDYCAYIGYLGNGTTATATPLVAVGECTAGTSSLSGCIAYAYNGIYDTGWIATLPAGVTTTKVHNIGVDAINASVLVKCITADSAPGMAVGDISDRLQSYNATSGPTFTLPAALVPNRLSVILQANTGSGVGFVLPSKTNGTYANATSANYQYKIVVRRTY